MKMWISYWNWGYLSLLTVDGRNPTNQLVCQKPGNSGINYLPTGAGFLNHQQYHQVGISYGLIPVKRVQLGSRPSFLISQSRVDICHNVSTVDGDGDDDDDDDADADADDDETMAKIKDFQRNKSDMCCGIFPFRWLFVINSRGRWWTSTRVRRLKYFTWPISHWANVGDPQLSASCQRTEGYQHVSTNPLTKREAKRGATATPRFRFGKHILVRFHQMSESTLSAGVFPFMSLGGGVGGDPFRSLLDLQYWCTSSRKCIWILLLWPVWAVVLVYIFRRCARVLNFQCFLLFGTQITVRARIREKHLKLMKKNVKLMKKTWNSWKKHEIHKKNVKFMKKTWNSLKQREIH